AELTYGLERICMYLQNVENVYDVEWTRGIPYREVFHANEVEMSTYAFRESDPEVLFQLFTIYEKECQRLLARNLSLPAYDYALTINLLDGRGRIPVAERAGFIKRVRDNARLCAEGYLRSREELGYPLLKTRWTVGEQMPPIEGKPASEFWKTVSFGKKEEAR